MSADQRLSLLIQGTVQGVGFRPFVYRLATSMGLKGWVNNSAQGVAIEVEGSPDSLDRFAKRVEHEKPHLADIWRVESVRLPPRGYKSFDIHFSETSGAPTVSLLPDVAICADCLRELVDPSNRRFRYPFTNCTNCGPRFSIIEALPYDRPRTTMRRFQMCEQCLAEYENPLDRRFHAQPNACPQCGPHLELWDRSGLLLFQHDAALIEVAQAIRQGKIIAIKGLGGFQLVVDARSEETVQRLRVRKRREEKPFALMYPSLDAVRQHCCVSDLEQELLCSTAAPIVLLERKDATMDVAPAVAPRNPYLGVMLPYTPLHHLLLAELGFPMVATSGNLSDEPICTDEYEALERLGGVADLFLVHDRPIVQRVDDSVVRVMGGRELILRRARGYAPLPIHVEADLPDVLAVGGQLKNSIAASVGRQVFISQHIGDLHTAPAYEAFRRTVASFESLYDLHPDWLACDAHPDYLSTQYAQAAGMWVIQVQHHYAHVLACMAENRLAPPVLGVCWDGTGYGLDGSIWGGEFLLVTDQSFTRAAYCRQFRLPGGDRAIREPRRAAVGVLYELFGDDLFTMLPGPVSDSFTAQEQTILLAMLRQAVNAPLTSSAGRLFDAVAALVGLRQFASYEGQAAMELEFIADRSIPDERYDFTFYEGENAGIRVVDWGPLLLGIIADLRASVAVPVIAARFHNTLAEVILRVAQHLGFERIALSGGCFQNRFLTERAIELLRTEGFQPFWHRHVPPNDGGIALGQIIAASRELEE